MRRLIVAALLFAVAARGEDLRVDSVRHALLGAHTRYQQYINGLPVIGGERIEGPLGTHDALARRGFSHAESSVVSAHGNDLVYVNVDGLARLAIREVSSGPKPVATFFDAATGAALMERRLWFDVSGRVFVPNPVAKLNDPSLTDQNNSAAAVPSAAYSTVDLFGLAASGPLAGPNVQIVDIEAPFTARAEASQSLLFDRSQPQFEEVNAYFHIDRSQRYIQSLGYTGIRRIAGYAIPVDAHAVNGSDNSFYASGNLRGQGQLYFGDGGTDDAEDADIMLHEFAHAVHDWIAPDAFNGTSGSEARALAEGFGDYWAFSQTYDDTVSSGRDAACIGDWDARCFGDDTGQRCGYPAGSDCLRRVDGRKTMGDFLRVDSSGFEHRNGEIWSSALRDIFLSTQNHRGVDVIVLESLFGAPANPTFAWQAKRLLEVDAAMGSAFRPAICRALTTRGILAVTDCAKQPRGEQTLFQSTTSSIRVDDMRAIEDVLVRVQAGSPAKITLVAPDGTQVLLSPSFVGDATFGRDALPAASLAVLKGRSAAGEWRLFVEGAAVRSWSLIIQFAGDALAMRPITTQLAKHLPVVGHVTGAANTLFTSDVTIVNRSNLSASLIAIFTPTDADGRTQFSAIRLSILPGRTMVLDDIVQNTFLTSGLGQLELLGDADRILASVYTNAGGFGDSSPALKTSQAGAEDVAPLQNTIALRSNVGVAEVLGGSGTVHFTFFDAAGRTLAQTEVAIAPFGHAQIRVPVVGANLRARATVTGDARVIAYGTTVDNRSGDSFIVPASSLGETRSRWAVVTVMPLPWRTDYWRLASSGVVETSTVPVFIPGYVQALIFLDTSAAAVFSRTYLPSTGNGLANSGFFARALTEPLRSPQHLVGISRGSRVTVGLVNFAALPANATIVVYDAAGNETQRLSRALGPSTIDQFVLESSTASRIEVHGDVAGYLVLQDSITSDMSYITGQY
jgi:hypothetical protein